MKRTVLISSFVVLTFLATACAKKEASTPATAQKPSAAPSAKIDTVLVTKGGISVIEAAACKSVEGRNPVGAAEKFSSNIGRLYVFTKVGLDASRETSIKHVWKHNGKEVSTVTLAVKGPQWRTYSSKQIDATHKGDWRVDVETDKNEVLKSVSFKIE